ncbi:MAG: thymidine phosphorylase [Spirochaetales bacterium]|nr:thymidine phosphorylase [Spirochaetales bacterium]
MLRPVDIIVKKRNKDMLTAEEIAAFVSGYCNGTIPEYQMASWLMAVYFNGMTPQETADLTNAMIHSGRVLDLSDLGKPLVDKHSTGGVGDKTSMILAPVMAALGFADPMMSGRGLGHTGGTLDKLESVSGYNVHLSEQQVRDTISGCGFAMFAQSDDMVVADKKMYALRDVTGTVESIPLMTASILSKKLAEGTKYLVMDVKFGSGAFMKNKPDAQRLAESLVRTGEPLGLSVKTLITDMSAPLGECVGNLLEMQEVARIMRDGLGKNRMSQSLEEVTVDLAALMVQSVLPDKSDEDAHAMVRDVINNGSAYKKFIRNIELQGGNPDDLWRPIKCCEVYELKAPCSGIIEQIDAYKIGLSSMCLGAGRRTVDDIIDHECGIILRHRIGDTVAQGDTIAELHYNRLDNIEEAIKLASDAVKIISNS